MGDDAELKKLRDELNAFKRDVERTVRSLNMRIEGLELRARKQDDQIKQSPNSEIISSFISAEHQAASDYH